MQKNFSYDSVGKHESNIDIEGLQIFSESKHDTLNLFIT